MIQEPSAPVSVIGQIDPRIKIVVAFFFSVVVAVSDCFSVLFLSLAVGLSIVVAANIPPKEVARRLIPVNALVIFLWFFLPFTFSGEPLFAIMNVSVSHEGVLHAARISIKSNTIMLMLIALAVSTSIFTLGHALHELGVPKKLVHLFFFTYRYIHVIYREYLRLLNAMKIRGFTPGTNLHTYKSFAYMVGMLLVKSADRAQRVYNAMRCRGFKGDFYSLSEFCLTKKDIACFVLMAAIIICLGVLEWKKNF